jgi:hypothetical protein
LRATQKLATPSATGATPPPDGDYALR